MGTLTLPSTGYERLFDIDRVVEELAQARQLWRTRQQRLNESGGRHLPSRDVLDHIMENLCGILFPMRLGPVDLHQESENFYVGHTLDAVLYSLLSQVQLELRTSSWRPNFAAQDEAAVEIVRAFSLRLPRVRTLLDSDVLAAFSGDPAARNVDEVLLCYPGIVAMIYHRVAHNLHTLGAPLVARIVAELAHGLTGIDIHPGACIDEGFFIDHGTGVVIGETTIIGKNVRVYQAVTLGAKSFPKDSSGQLSKGLARHPIVQDDVVIYAGATVLGRVTLGRGARIGGNVWITHDVAPGAHITQAHFVQHATQP